MKIFIAVATAWFLLEFFGYAYFIVAEKELTFRKSQLIAFVVCNLALFAFGFHLIVGEH